MCLLFSFVMFYGNKLFVYCTVARRRNYKANEYHKKGCSMAHLCLQAGIYWPASDTIKEALHPN